MVDNKILITFLAIDIIFLLTGALMLAVGIIYMPSMTSSIAMQTDVGTRLLLQNTPLTAALANAVLVFFTFFVSIPGAIISKNRTFLRVTSWLIIACALFSLALGLDIWFSTLSSRTNFGILWSQQTAAEQSLLQQQFNCCGWMNSTSPPFVTDNVCPTAAAAAQKVGCVVPFWSFANSFLDIVFTSLFGIVALDGILFLSTVVVLKDRAQKERYRLIDEKTGQRI
ncbi:phospholipid scramblase 1 [Trapelia coarctata]|nr:phospholipid scramblase 1 [Trapelia coarctata]